jgi:hypothetical protein
VPLVRVPVLTLLLASGIISFEEGPVSFGFAPRFLVHSCGQTTRFGHLTVLGCREATSSGGGRGLPGHKGEGLSWKQGGDPPEKGCDWTD